MDASVCRRAAVTVAAVAMLVGCGASQPVVRPVSAMMSPLSTARPFSPPRPASTATEPPQPLQSPRAPRELPVDPGAGRLPQTEKFPSTHDEAFRNAMADLWLAVTTGKPEYARPAFFPETAYEQVKAIPYPAQDWTGRLWLDFELDVGAAHDVVGKDARLLTTEMAPDSEAAWVLPGYCANRVGYWHINGARLVYRKDGQERSIGIASLISWRGVWYVVHFGAVIRPAVGIVNDPEIGPGVPGPAGGC